MREEADLISKIKLQTQELEEIQKNIEKIEEENDILTEQKGRMDEQIEEKRKELKDKQAIIENSGKNTRVNKEDINDAERREKDLDDLVTDKLLDLMVNEEDKRKLISENNSANSPMIISAVLIRYIPELGDGDIEGMDKADPQEALFRLSHNTTFKDIKATACEFWKIDDFDSVGLRASNYTLLDLYMDQNVQEKILTLRMPPELWLFKINKLAKTTFTELKDCFIDSAIANQFKIGAPPKKKENKSTGFRKSLHRKIMEKIKAVYKGLESFEKKPINNISTDHIEIDRNESPQHNFLICVIVLIISTITILLLTLRRDVTEDFWIQAGLNTELMSQNSSINFWDINNLDDVNNYLLNTVGPAMYANDNLTSVIPRRYHMAGSLRIRQVRSRLKQCIRQTTYHTSLPCYEYKYKDSTKFTENLAGGMPYQTYHASTSAPASFVGEIDTYDNSGFYADFSSNLTLNQFQAQYTEIMNTTWLDQGTRAIFITSNFFLPNTNQFIAILIFIENNVMGQSFPSKLQAQTLKSNLYSQSPLDNCLLAIEIIRLLLSFYLLYLYIIKCLEKDSHGKMSISNWYSVRNLTNLMIFVLIIAAFATSLQVNKKAGDILQDNYTDLIALAGFYSSSMILNCWVLLISCFRLIMTMKFMHTINLYLYTLDHASKNIIYYLFILTPVLVALCVLTAHMFGPFDFYYRTLKLVAISNILFTIGYRDLDEFILISPAWTIAFLIVYFYVIMFFLYSAFLGIIFDSYRISELRQRSVREAHSKDPEYKPWKIWISSSFKKCRKARSEAS